MVQAHQAQDRQSGAGWPTILRPPVGEPETPEPAPAAPRPSADDQSIQRIADFWPQAPATIAETGLSPVFLEELVLKTIHYAGPSNIEHVSRRMGMSLPVVQELTDKLKAGNFIESQGVSLQDAQQYSMLGYRMSLTERGEQRAGDALSRSRYAGLAPVPLDQYVQLTELQKSCMKQADAEQIDRALSRFVLADALRESIAYTFHSGRPALVYGETGNGKTSIVEAFARSFQETVLIPGALYVNGQIVRVFDASVHDSVETEPGESSGGAPSAGSIGVLRQLTRPKDRRWLAVRRPVVMVGGELTAESLELAFDQVGGFYQAPPHLKAQHGIFVIDDLGRQRIRPDELLNRWIVPLERGQDLLTLKSGERLQVPFDTTVLFSTNLSPSDLADEAFLRRIPYKVQITNPGPAEIAEIARRECRRRGMVWDEVAIRALVEALFSPGHSAPKSVYPRDLLQIIEENARYRDVVPALTRPAIEAACRIYFVNGAAPSVTAARGIHDSAARRYYVPGG